MFGRRFLNIPKSLKQVKMETMMVRKPVKRRLGYYSAQKLVKRLVPLQPLKYKLQTLPNPDTTWNNPLGNTEKLPFFV